MEDTTLRSPTDIGETDRPRDKDRKTNDRKAGSHAKTDRQRLIMFDFTNYTNPKLLHDIVSTKERVFF